MSTTELRPPIRIFSTCPPSSDYPSGDAYRSKVTQVARWSEAAGCEGILVYTDNRLADPWVVSQLIVEATESLAPLVAVQPIYAHPYTVAKAIASFAYLYGRRLHLNMVAGGFKRDLAALDDPTPHDERYLRLIEYTGIVMKLLRSTTPVSFHGQYYGLEQLKLAPALEGHLLPDVFVSGSSAAGMEAARLLDATAVKYPRSAAEEESASGTEDAGPLGIRVGVLARQTDEEAWSEAHARFPGDRRGELLHGIAMKVSDSEWHRQLSESSKGDREGPYWLFPFQCYKTFCPYLVGSYYRVAGELARYMEQGVRTFILDVPLREDDLKHANFTFELALEVAVR
jgi:alkanesulfonate monooxygenase